MEQLDALQGQRVAVVGYGSQGRTHARNLRDSGVEVVAGVRPGGASWALAEADGFEPCPPGDAVRGAGVVALLVPDLVQSDVFEAAVRPNLEAGALCLFAHGFVVHYGQVRPPADVDVALVAPKGPGPLVRREFEAGRGVPCLYAVAQDVTGTAEQRARAYAAALGAERAGLLWTTFAEETETDLFGEQAVLCGGVVELVQAGWETLVDAGYSPEVAYFECMHELKLIVDLFYEGGFTRMHEAVSETAAYGGATRGGRVLGPEVRERMQAVLAEVRSGAFAKEWLAEQAGGRARYAAACAQHTDHPIEAVGRRLRAAAAGGGAR